jgi:hypothetical protein
MQTIARKFSQTNENKVVVVWYRSAFCSEGATLSLERNIDFLNVGSEGATCEVKIRQRE